MHWHLAVLTLVLEVVTFSWTMLAALVQSLLSWTVIMTPVLAASVATMRMLE